MMLKCCFISRGVMPLDDLRGKRGIIMDNQRRNRVKQRLRIRLGILQMIHMPILNTLLVPIVILEVAIWKVKDKVFAMIDIPQILFPICKFSINFLTIMIPILVLCFLLEMIGNLIARKDEQDLAEAFDSHDLRNGCPILMNKKRIKGSNVIMREFYSSSIPMKVWIEKQEDIADSMNVHFVEPLRYGGKSNGRRIVMYTASGRENASRGNLYDDEL